MLTYELKQLGGRSSEMADQELQKVGCVRIYRPSFRENKLKTGTLNSGTGGVEELGYRKANGQGR